MVTDFYRDIQACLNEVDNDVVEKVLSIWKSDFQYQRRDSGRVFIIGNGGSCAIAEHISTDLNKRCKVKAYTLSNNSLTTCLSNDYGYHCAFREWLKLNHVDEFDFLVAISSSGKSLNILNAIQFAQSQGTYVLSIFGMDAAKPVEAVENNSFIHINSFNYGVIELTTETILHGIIEELVL